MTLIRAVLRRYAGAGIAVLLAVAVTASASGVAHYQVRPGDTLSAIALRYHTTVAALVRLNHLPGNGNLIYAGSTLAIPSQHPAAGPTHRFRTVTSIYVVRPGDSLYAIAARFHARWQGIVRRNHLPSSLIVVIGQRLKIPHRIRVHVPSQSTAPVPSRDAVAAMIRATAGRWHVDPRLALGVSYEESGFNQAVVSSVGAVGAMQIMPTT
ncbi:MAG: hypothetical protein QOJ03_2699, partial [Frankiaceae bacterium]|nr:hypothetical protein [Frankiaceae bacterium]